MTERVVLESPVIIVICLLLLAGSIYFAATYQHMLLGACMLKISMSSWRIRSFYFYVMPLFILDTFPFSVVFFVGNYNSYSSYPLISVNMIFLYPLTYPSLYI